MWHQQSKNTSYDSLGVSSNGTMRQHQPVALIKDASHSWTARPPATIQERMFKKRTTHVPLKWPRMTFLLEFNDHRCLVTIFILKYFPELQESVKSHVNIISWCQYNPFRTCYKVLYLYTYCLYDVVGRFVEYLWACVSHLRLKSLFNLKFTRKRLSCEKMRTEQKIKTWLLAASFTRRKSVSPLTQTPSSSKVSALHRHTASTHVLRGGHRMVAQAGERTRALLW